ncbi:MAG: hypothetical protein Q9227_004218 [Pyrenula ochraceoflavens]
MDEPPKANWIDSSLVQLSTNENTPTEYLIHRDLLQQFDNNISIRRKRRTMGDSREETEQTQFKIHTNCASTLMRFIQWAYTRNYSLATSTTCNCDCLEGHNEFIDHALVYNTAVSHEIPELKDLALGKLTSNIVEAFNSCNFESDQDDVSKQGFLEGIVDLLDRVSYSPCFDKVEKADKMMTWLGRFVAWRMEDFRRHSRFMDVVFPEMHSYVLPNMISAAQPPWQLSNPYQLEGETLESKENEG